MDNIDNKLTSDELKEYNALKVVINSFIHYESWATNTIYQPKRLKYESLNNDEKKLLTWFPDYLKQLEQAIRMNGKYFTTMAMVMNQYWGNIVPDEYYNDSNTDFSSVLGILNQYVREWSEDGFEERENSFGRILKFAEDKFPNVLSRPQINVLVPGAGLGRLLVEFSKRGFRVEGNEISYYMLLNSNYLLNECYFKDNFFIYPFIHKSSNILKRNYQLRQVFFPDVNTDDIYSLTKQYPSIPVSELMSMIAGGFTDLYGPPDLGKLSDLVTNDPSAMEFRAGNKGKFQLVITCFFLDTATNIIDYLKTIMHCMADDGYWLNFGPLLWHYENNNQMLDIKTRDLTGNYIIKEVPLTGLEISLEDLIKLIEDMGFEFVDRESGIPSSYGGDSRSMANWTYNCEYWICSKRRQ